MTKLFDTRGSGIDGLAYLPEGIQLLNSSPPEKPVVGWVGIQHGPESTIGSLNFLDVNTRKNRCEIMPGRPGFFVQTDWPNVFIAGLTDRLYQVVVGQTDFCCHELRYKTANRPNHIINDGQVISKGLLFGTKATKWLEPDGELYLLPFADPRRLITVATGVQCSNGIVELGEDGNWAHVAYIDSPKKKIVELAIDSVSGQYREVRTIADFTKGDAFPDGQRAVPGSGQVRHLAVSMFNPLNPLCGSTYEVEVETGQITHEWVTVGAARNTCMTFVPSANNSVNMITTTADEGTPDEQWGTQTERGNIFIGNTSYRADMLRPSRVFPLELLAA